MSTILMTICVIHAESTTEFAAGDLFWRAGFAVEAYEGTEEYLRRRTGEEPDCLLINTGELCGVPLEMVQTLRLAGCCAPILVMTACTDMLCAVKLMKLGVADVLMKPVEEEALISRTQEVIRDDQERRRLHEEVRVTKARLAQLRPEEIALLRQVASGAATREVAEALGVGERTAKHRINCLLAKIEVYSVAELVRRAVGARLV